MASLAAILFILAAAAVAGWLVRIQFGSWPAATYRVELFIALTLGILILGWLALLLAELDLFSTTTLLLMWAGLVAGLIVLNRARPAVGQTEVIAVVRNGITNRPRLSTLLLAIWLLGAGWLFLRPHEYILGGADAGVYVSLGAEIAQGGGFRLTDETLAAMDPQLQQAVLRPLPTNPVAPAYLYPGFYVTDANSGSISPQFYPLHPVWQAVGYALTPGIGAGTQTALLLPGLWMLLATIAVALIAYDLSGRAGAILLLLALPYMALQVWFARYPTTEALTQFLLWAGLWAVLRWLGGRVPAALYAFLAGLALGSIFLVRIDVLLLLPLLAVLLLALWYRGWQKADTWFAAPLSILVLHSVLHGLILSAPYFYEHVGYGFGLLWANSWILVLGGIAGVLFLVGLWAMRTRSLTLLRLRRPLLLLTIAAFLIFALYSWFVRPYVAEASLRPDLYSESLLLITNHENFLRLGWYLAVPGIWLGVAGICLLIWRVNGRTALLIATGLTFTVVYVWNIRANPHQVYVMRRYVPAVVPFFMLGGAYLIAEIGLEGVWQRLTAGQRPLAVQLPALLLTLIWLTGVLWSARGFVSQVDYDGLFDQLAGLEEQLPPQAILLFNDQAPVGQGDFWGTPLTYIFDHQAYTIRDPQLLESGLLAETIEIWQNSGRDVVWFGEPEWLLAQGIAHDLRTFELAGRRLESSYEYKPQAVIEERWPLQAAFLQPLP